MGLPRGCLPTTPGASVHGPSVQLDGDGPNLGAATHPAPLPRQSTLGLAAPTRELEGVLVSGALGVLSPLHGLPDSTLAGAGAVF